MRAPAPEEAESPMRKRADESGSSGSAMRLRTGESEGPERSARARMGKSGPYWAWSRI